MGKNKLKKFAEMKQFRCALEYPREELIANGFPHRGKWNGEVFAASAPIVLELGCGRGEYTVGLAKADPARNFVGVDIKGARLWAGAKTVEEEQIPNAAFLRTEIENIKSFFSPGEVDELWITFPDPQMQKPRKRLTSTRFLQLYRSLLRPDGVISLKTDSPFLYEYTRRLVTLNGFEVLVDNADIYSENSECSENSESSEYSENSARLSQARAIRTYYEQQWLSRGKSIKLLTFRLPAAGDLREPPSDDIPRDDYRSTKGRTNVEC